jgi:hypothetical protein
MMRSKGIKPPPDISMFHGIIFPKVALAAK